MNGGTTVRPFGLLARMVLIDVTRRPGRLVLLAGGIGLAAAAAFGSLVFNAAIGRSLERSVARLGADAVVLPAGVTANLTPTLLSVEPSTATLADAVVQRITALPAVAATAPQRTLQVADIGGHLPIDIVVIDPARDVTVGSWVVDGAAADRLSSRGVIVGGRRAEAVGERFAIQGVELVVEARLGLTGAGPFERSMFITPATAGLLASGGVVTADGQPFPADPLASPSGLVVRLEGGRGPEDLRFAAAAVPEVTVITGPGSQIEVRQGLAALVAGSLAGLALSLLVPAVLVAVAYTGMLAERRRELGTMLALGMTPGHVVAAVAFEATLAAVAGVVVGVAVAAITIATFLRTIGFGLESRGVPFLLPTASEVLGFAGMSVAAVSLTAVVGAISAAWVAARRRPWQLLRGDPT